MVRYTQFLGHAAVWRTSGGLDGVTLVNSKLPMVCSTHFTEYMLGGSGMLAGLSMRLQRAVCVYAVSMRPLKTTWFAAMLQVTGAVYWDAIGSIAVSGLLGVVAVTLIQRNRKWLIGKSMPKVSGHTSCGYQVHSYGLMLPFCTGNAAANVAVSPWN